MAKVLVVVDEQEDFARLALGDAAGEQVIKESPEIVEFAVKNGFSKIIYTADTHRDGYLDTLEGKCLPIWHCKPGTEGHKICHEVYDDIKIPQGVSIMIEKDTFGAIGLVACKDIFDKADEVWIIGLRTNMCVIAQFFIIKAISPDLPITVIKNACAGTSDYLHQAALDVMENCFARIVDWADLKKEMEGTSNEA